MCVLERVMEDLGSPICCCRTWESELGGAFERRGVVEGVHLRRGDVGLTGVEVERVDIDELRNWGVDRSCVCAGMMKLGT